MGADKKNEQATATQANVSQNQNTVTVKLEYPIERANNQTIDTLTIRKPKPRHLKGINNVELANLNTDAVLKVLPRVCEPPVFADDLDDLDPHDLISLGGAIVSFFTSAEERREVQASLQK